MFTGLIEAVCRVTEVRPDRGCLRLTIDLQGLAAESSIGDSIAVNGACLTSTSLKNTIAPFDVSAETLAKPTIGKLKPGSLVNADRALKPTDRIGGHFVQGHVDATAKIKTIDKKNDFADITFTASPELLDQMIPKGSVAVDGVSLTIAKLDSTSFTVAIIPQTWQDTNFTTAKVGDTVNIETDIITKTIKKQLEKILPQSRGLTAEKLKELGF